MGTHPVKTPASRLFTGVRVLLACFLAVGIWKTVSGFLHEKGNLLHEGNNRLLAQTVETRSTIDPSSQSLIQTNHTLLDETLEQVAQRQAEVNNPSFNKPLPMPPERPKSGNNNELLAWAVEVGDSTLVKDLLRKGTDPNVKIEGAKNHLAEAAWNGDLTIVKLLLRYGADVNPKGDRISPLACASYSDSDGLPIMKLLIRHGADVNARFDSDTTVMTIAQYHGGDEAVALLKRHGARR
nr:ankyrin repeat domain-containing protein [Armatimonas sp.]